mmetsp:Transcript_32932/g.53692  ORF Transcript_32932/g.53692 Transcript_32932/m.53692 type:complete len:385 (+) Transcript_32932:178-1332(+)
MVKKGGFFFHTDSAVVYISVYLLVVGWSVCLVQGHAGVDLPGPGQDAPVQVKQPLPLKARCRQRLAGRGGPAAGLAVHQQVPVARELVRHRRRLSVWHQRVREGQADNLCLLGQPHVQDEGRPAPRQPRRRRRRAHPPEPLLFGRRLGRGGPHAAEPLVVHQLVDLGIGPPPDLDLSESHAQRIVDKDAAGKDVPLAQDELDHLCCLYTPNHTRQNSQHTSFCTRRYLPRGRGLGQEVPVGGPDARRPVPHAGLALEPQDRPIYTRYIQDCAGVVDQVLGWEIIRAVQHYVITAEHPQRVVAGQLDPVQHHLAVRVEVGHARRRRFHLGLADRAGSVGHLPLQVALVHHVVVHQADAAHAGGREVEQRGAPQAARPDQAHRGGL